MQILEVQKLAKNFGNKTIIPPLDFTLQKGEILGILGANGAGKTTVLSMLLGLLKPSAGTIKYFGLDFAQNQSFILGRIGNASAYTQLPAPLSIWRNLDIYARLYGLNKKERHTRITQLIEELGIDSVKNQNVQNLSAGEMTRAMLIKAFVHNPEIVLLDEPTASLDVEIATKIRAFLLQKQKEQISCIITSHNMADMTTLCDRILVMHQGKIIASGTPEQLVAEIKTSILRLMAEPAQLQKLIEFAQRHKLSHRLATHEIELDVDSKSVALILQEISQQNIRYLQVNIQEPSLEDYVLSLAERAIA